MFKMELQAEVLHARALMRGWGPSGIVNAAGKPNADNPAMKKLILNSVSSDDGPGGTKPGLVLQQSMGPSLSTLL